MAVANVGIADYKIIKSPDQIMTVGLGSCCGVVIYDEINKIAGLVHILLSESKTDKNLSNRAKFADTGIEDLLQRVLALGAVRRNLVAKIAGGAQMFAFKSDNDMLRVGDRNVEATKAKLQELHIPILAEDTGKNSGRTIEFYPETGELLVKSVGKTPYKI